MSAPVTEAASPAQRFSRAMLPLAVLAGAVVAIVPPLSHALVARQKLDGEARVHAAALARAVHPLAEREPLLWRYNTPKMAQAAALHRNREDIAAVRVLGCDGEELVPSRRFELGTGASGGPVGLAPVRARGQLVAFVEVRMDRRDEARRTAGIGLVSALLGLLVGVLLFRFPTRVVQRLAERLAAANRELEARVAAAVAAAQALSQRVVHTQEEERRRIARDLHDGVGQQLTGLRLELELSASQASAEERERLSRAMRTCDETLAEIRRVVRDLRPLELETGDAVAALSASAERFEARTGLATSFRHEGGPVTGDDVALCLLRVLQEALSNVARHAEAHEVGVLLAVREGEVRLEIRDDGRGFDPARIVEGSGLSGLRERCAFLGGEARVVSAPGAGTRIEVRLPQRAPRPAVA